jgi:polar amino acid transport system permease protein
MGYDWNFAFVPDYAGVLAWGLLTTLWLSALVILTSTAIGTAVGVLMSQENAGRQPMIVSVDVIRSVPLIVLILWVYYLFPALGYRSVPPFWSAAVALTINNAAFLADIVRGSIEGLPKGGMLAARTLGMDRMTILRRITVPEVYREVFPSLTLLSISVIRLSSLASVIAVAEVTHVGNLIIANTFKPLETYTVVTLLYLVIVYPLTVLSRRFERSKYFLRRTI